MEIRMNTRNALPDDSTAVGRSGNLTTLAEKMSRLPESRRKAIDEQAEFLIAEEMSLQAIRRARRMTQATVAEELGINQENVSRLERRTDFLISSLRNYLEAMGGELHLVVDFPDRPPITISGISSLEDYDVDLNSDEAATVSIAVNPELNWSYTEEGEGTFQGERTESLYDSGLAYLEAAQFDKAIEAFDAAIDSNPYFSEAFSNRALAHLEINEGEKAKSDIEAIRSILARSA